MSNPVLPLALAALRRGLQAYAVAGRARLRRLWSPEADRHFVWNVRSREGEFAELDAQALACRIVGCRATLTREGPAGEALAVALALMCLLARRTCGLTVPDHLLAAVRVALAGSLARLEPGEGKSTAALLTAAVLAWAGQAVRVQTASLALAERDVARAAPLLTALGLKAAMLPPAAEAAGEPPLRLPVDTVYFGGPAASWQAAAGGWLLLDDPLDLAADVSPGGLRRCGFASGPFPPAWVPGLPVLPITAARARQLRRLPSRMYPGAVARRAAILGRVMDLVEEGRPVLVAVESLAEAQTLSRLLAEAYVDHQVLTARLPAQAQAQLPEAGALAAVTLATGPVVLGDGLPLAPGVAERGGLHLLDCQQGAASALPQWAHCVARRGEPGSMEAWFSLDDARVVAWLPPALAQALAWYWPGERPLEAAGLIPWSMDVLARRLKAWRDSSRPCADT